MFLLLISASMFGPVSSHERIEDCIKGMAEHMFQDFERQCRFDEVS